MQYRSQPIYYTGLLLLACLCCALTARGADVPPQRLLLLRGVIALADHHTDEACADLREAVNSQPEEWRTQSLYAAALAAAGQPAAARVCWRQVLLLAPCSVEAWQTVARAARTAEDRQLELTACAGLLRLMPGDPQMLARLAELYRATGQATAAEQAQTAGTASMPPLKLDDVYLYFGHPATRDQLLTLLETDKTNPAVYNALAAVEWKAGHADAAREAVKQSILLAPKSTDMVASYVHLCLLAGQLDEAVRALQAAAPLGDYALDRALAHWSMAQGHYADAIAPLKRLLMRNAVDAALNRQLGMAAMLADKPEEALSALRLAWMTGRDALSAQLYAAALLAAGQRTEAETLLKAALQASPYEPTLSLLRARCAQEDKRPKDAAEITAELAAHAPDPVLLWLLAGERFQRAGYVQRAYTIACMLRDQYPADPIALHGAIRLFRLLDIGPEARLALTRYLGPGPAASFPSLDIMLQLSRLAIDDNRLDEAAHALEEVVKGRPTCEEAYTLLGRVYLQQGNWPAARQLYGAATTRWPDEPTFLLGLARAAAQEGNLPLAIDTFRHAAVENPSADPYLELGLVYRRQGDEDQARGCWIIAQMRPGGEVRARLSLLGSYERTGETPRVIETLDALLKAVAVERAASVKHWQQVLADAGLAPTAEEIAALQQLDPNLPDTAPLQARLDALRATETH